MKHFVSAVFILLLISFTAAAHADIWRIEATPKEDTHYWTSFWLEVSLDPGVTTAYVGDVVNFSGATHTLYTPNR